MSSDGGAAARKSTKYRGLISSFINGQISAQEFKSSYLKMFKNDQDYSLDEDEFDILETLFTDADDYSADPEYREYVRAKDPEFRKYVHAFDEEELRGRAREAYRKLYEA
ncbi:colicin immunity domain-containing protein [Mycobacterium persicum]|nr:colicin immunity domain-containing protein [Mycobacterium persicum]KZS85801.1 hypothetical protein A4G31_03590 [Mycobacterium persicum]ORB46614.1 hypothetical protein BST40_18030 [Mycobacterium persicum]ORB88584.1 hypothetical protein B1T49_04090 [Mycobacterium persicum]ORB93896.1 hypothetical protein B1T44_04415 [Mycobacterium persicum]ORC06003.1 hypothetical protein B4U45_04440 [Mycobacterium persicum]